MSNETARGHMGGFPTGDHPPGEIDGGKCAGEAGEAAYDDGVSFHERSVLTRR